jgi:hypothetical protein
MTAQLSEMREIVVYILFVSHWHKHDLDLWKLLTPPHVLTDFGMN